MARNPLREIVQESLQGKADNQKVFYGYLGDADGTVIVPGKENYVYVTLTDGMVAQAYNVLVPPILNFPVIVGFDPKQARSDLLRILGVRDVPRIGKQDSAYHVDAHHVSHEWLNAQGGTDVVYVQLRQFMPLRPTPIAPYSINIARDVQMIGTTWQTVGAETIDLTSYVPTTYTGNLGNERFVVLSLNPSTGAVDITSGSMVTAGSSSMSNIPAAPTGNYPICAVRLYTNQVKIIEARSATDLIDLRWGVFASNALLHNALGGLNVGDYQHLTAAQLVVVQNTSGSNTGNQVVPLTTGSAPGYYLTGYNAITGSFTSGSVAASSGGGGHVIQSSGSPMPAQPNLNFVGATVTDDVSGSATKVTITAGTSGSATFGGLYAEDVSIPQTLALAATYYPVTTGSFVYGEYSGVTPQNNCELKILTAGRYLVNWSMSLSCNASDQTIEGLIMGGSSGSTAQVQTGNATRAKENGVVYSVGGTGFINCNVNDIIRLGLENETSAGTVVTINHANLAIMLSVAGAGPDPLSLTVTKEVQQISKVLYSQTLATSGSLGCTGLDQTYDHLLVRLFGRSSVGSTGEGSFIFVNNDTTLNHYIQARQFGGASQGGDVAFTPVNVPISGSTSPTGDFVYVEVRIPKYTGTQEKVMKVMGGDKYTSGSTGSYTVEGVQTWASGSAITSISFIPASGSAMMAGSWIEVVGIKSGSVVTDVSGSGTKGEKGDKGDTGTAGGIGADGWMSAGETWTFVSADAPTFVYSTGVDVSGIYSPGMRIKYSQSGSTAYGILTAISGSLVTFYGGTDYSMSGSAITNPKYSPVKAPFGFPISPRKWSVVLSGSASVTQAAPTQNVYYNLGGAAITVPIGEWLLGFECNSGMGDGATVYRAFTVIFSTSGSSASDPELYSINIHDPCYYSVFSHAKRKYVNITTKKVYSLLHRTSEANVDNMYLYTGWSIYAVSSYL